MRESTRIYGIFLDKTIKMKILILCRYLSSKIVFRVEGGKDRAQLTFNNPLYLSEDPHGAFDRLTDEEKAVSNYVQKRIARDTRDRPCFRYLQNNIREC